MVIYSWFSHKKRWFSIATLNYQRVMCFLVHYEYYWFLLDVIYVYIYMVKNNIWQMDANGCSFFLVCFLNPALVHNQWLTASVCYHIYISVYIYMSKPKCPKYLCPNLPQFRMWLKCRVLRQQNSAALLHSHPISRLNISGYSKSNFIMLIINGLTNGFTVT